MRAEWRQPARCAFVAALLLLLVVACGGSQLATQIPPPAPTVFPIPSSQPTPTEFVSTIPPLPVATPALAKESEPLEDVIERVSSGVYFVEARTCEGSASGSAFRISDTDLATAAHVVEGATEIFLVGNGHRVRANVVGRDERALPLCFELWLQERLASVAGEERRTMPAARSEPLCGTTCFAAAVAGRAG